jgi:hypothetical protein
MPIALTTPHRHDPGHGQPPVDYPYVMITEMTIGTVAKTMVLALRYGDVVDGQWVDSPEEPHRIRIRNIPADTQGAENPDTGVWEVHETSPADPQFDNMKASFLIDGGMMNGWETYDVLGLQLYTWLISQGYYEGSIV